MFVITFLKAVAFSWRVAFAGFPEEPARQTVELPPLPDFLR